MGRPANFSTNFNSNVSVSAGGFGVTLVSVDPVFGIGHLLVGGSFLEIGDIIFEVRFTPFVTPFASTDPFFFLPTVNVSTLPALANFTLFDSVGGILEVDIIDVSFGFTRTISVKILFDFNLSVLIGAHNPNNLPGQWIVHI